MTTGGAFNYTGQDATLQVLMKLLGPVIPGGGEQLAPMLMQLIQAHTPLGRDALFGATLTSNMSAFGSANARLQNQISAASTQMMAPMLAARKSMFFEDVARTLMGAGASSTAVTSAAQGYSSNGIYNFMYTMLDPTGMKATGQYMATAASNLIRPGIGRGDRDAFAKARVALGGMFQDSTGKYNFDKKDYGGMEASEVAALTAAITRDTDFIGGADLNNAQSLADATKRLKDRVQEYAKALSPLKDVFGSDMNAILTSIEQISGQTLSQMGHVKARSMAVMMSDSTSTGKYGMEELMGMTGMVTKKFGGMSGLSPLTSLNASRTAMRAMNYATPGVLPANMTRSDYINSAANFAISTAASSGAEYVDRAYGMWAAAQPQGADTSVAAFQALIQANTSEYGNPIQTAMNLAEANSVRDLEKGLLTAGYRTAKEAGAGALVAARGSAAQSKGAFIAHTVSSLAVNEALLKLSGDANWGAEDTRGVITDLFSILDKDMSIFNMSDDKEALEAMKAVNKRRGVTMSDARLNLINAIRHYMFNSDRGKDTMNALFYLRGEKEQAEAMVKSASRREAIEGYGKYIEGDFKGVLNTLIKGGLKPGALAKYVSDIEKMNFVGDEEVIKELKLGSQIAADQAIRKYGTSPEKHKEVETYITDFSRYITSTDGLNNIGFRRHLGALAKMTPEERKTAAGKFHADMMGVYRWVTPAGLDRYIYEGAESITDPDELAKHAMKREYKLRDLFKTGGVDAVLKEVRVSAVRDKIDKITDMQADTKLRVSKMLDEHLKGGGTLDKTGLKSLTESIEAELEELKKADPVRWKQKSEAWDNLKGILNTSLQGTGEQAPVLNTLLGSLEQAVRQMIGVLEKINTQDANKPVDTKPKPDK